MLADIANGDTGAAEVFFLIAAIAFVVAAVLPLVKARGVAISNLFVCSGLCLTAIGLLLL